MRRRDGRYVCALCGAEIDAPIDAEPQRKFIDSSGGARIRALMIDGKEIHRCEVEPKPKAE